MTTAIMAYNGTWKYPSHWTKAPIASLLDLGTYRSSALLFHLSLRVNDLDSGSFGLCRCIANQIMASTDHGSFPHLLETPS